MGHFVFDPLRKCGVRFPKECPVIVVAEHRQLEEIDEEPRRFVAVLHDECIKLRLGICEGIVRAKVDEEFLDE